MARFNSFYHCVLAVALAFTVVSCGAVPTAINSSVLDNVIQKRAIASGVFLRVMSIGDSITWGAWSTSGNGYRWNLQVLLQGNPMEYVGSQKSGTMTNNANEGYPGAFIFDIAAASHYVLDSQPNIVLLMAGTNDINRDYETANAPNRLGRLLDQIITVCPDATIIVAKITPILDSAAAARAATYNEAIPGIVSQRTNAGSHIIVVDMNEKLTAADLADGLHPGDYGYTQMALVWYGGILQAEANGWIKAPVQGKTIRNSCSGTLSWNPSYNQIATGAGYGDAPFSSSWIAAGILATGSIGTGSDQGAGVRIADIDGNGYDDYLWVNPDTGGVLAYLNMGIVNGGVSWVYKGVIAAGVGTGAGVVFTDLNGDGRADYLWIAENGDVQAWINGGESSAGGYLWNYQGIIASGVGGTRETTIFADIDGDGRADISIVDSGGALNTWLNAGTGDYPQWQSIGIIASGKGDSAGVYLADLNNDGRADYIWLDSNGAATAYINAQGPTLVAPQWRSVGQITSGVGASRQNIIFGDLNGDGKSDYIVVDSDTGGLNVWLNGCSGGVRVAGDGIRFADLDGDGKDDYIFLDPNGAVTAYINGGVGTIGQSFVWQPQGVIASGGGAREDVHFADINGDGRDDYLVVDYKTGSVKAWQNGGRNGGSWTWSLIGEVFPGGKIPGPGPGVRFADINGDGRADVLFVHSNSAVMAWINGGPVGPSGTGYQWEPLQQIASGVGGAGEDIQFHDMNGDGRADYIWIDPVSGSVQEWRNVGLNPDGVMLWYPQGEVATGLGEVGRNIQFADTTGSGRGDYLHVDAPTGAVSEWYNGCVYTDGWGLGVDGGFPPLTDTALCEITPVDTTSEAGAAAESYARTIGAYFDWFLQKYGEDALAVNIWGKLAPETMNDNVVCNYPGGDCPAPKDCGSKYTGQVPLYFARAQLNNFYNYYNSLNNELIWAVLEQTNLAASVVEKFPLQIPQVPDEAKIVANVGAIFGILGAGYSTIPVEGLQGAIVGGVVSTLGGIFGLISSNLPTTAPVGLNAGALLGSSLANIFTATQKSIKQALASVADDGGSGPIGWPNFLVKGRYAHWIANLMDNGNFLYPLTDTAKTDIGASFRLLFAQNLAGLAMEAADWYILANAYSETDCVATKEQPGLWWSTDHGFCFSLESCGDGYSDAVASPQYTKPIDETTYSAATTDFHIDITELYLSSWQCQNSSNAYNQAPSIDFNPATLSNTKPPCFYSLPVIWAEPKGSFYSNPCNVILHSGHNDTNPVAGYTWLPDNLASIFMSGSFCCIAELRQTICARPLAD